jgi:hypothetical protein
MRARRVIGAAPWSGIAPPGDALRPYETLRLFPCTSAVMGNTWQPFWSTDVPYCKGRHCICTNRRSECPQLHLPFRPNYLLTCGYILVIRTHRRARCASEAIDGLQGRDGSLFGCVALPRRSSSSFMTMEPSRPIMKYGDLSAVRSGWRVRNALPSGTGAGRRA